MKNVSNSPFLKIMSLLSECKGLEAYDQSKCGWGGDTVNHGVIVKEYHVFSVKKLCNFMKNQTNSPFFKDYVTIEWHKGLEVSDQSKCGWEGSFG